MEKGRMIAKMEIHGEELRDLIRDHLIQNHPALRAFAAVSKKILIEVEDKQPTGENAHGFKDWNLLVEVFELAEDPSFEEGLRNT